MSYHFHHQFGLVDAGGEKVVAQLRSLIAAFVAVFATFRFNGCKRVATLNGYLQALAAAFDPDVQRDTQRRAAAHLDLARQAALLAEKLGALSAMEFRLALEQPERVTVMGISPVCDSPPPAIDLEFPYDLADRLALMDELALAIEERMALWDYGIAPPFQWTNKLLGGIVAMLRNRFAGQDDAVFGALREVLARLAEAKRAAESIGRG